MKTTSLIVAGAIALSSTAAFAFNGRSMVTLEGYETGNRQDRSLDLYNQTGSSNDTTGTNVSTMNIALNYTYAFSDAMMVGGIYKNWDKSTSGDVAASGDKSTTWGAQFIYNLAGKLVDTCYLGLRYEMKKDDATSSTASTVRKEVKTSTYTVEFGHRFNIGNLGGMNFTYSPSAELAFAKTAFDDSGVDDAATTTFNLNFVKFDVLF